MYFYIKHHRHEAEARVCTEFLRWQGREWEMREDDSSLRQSRGTGEPVILIEGGTSPYAVGMHQLWDTWNKEGRFLL